MVMCLGTLPTVSLTESEGSLSYTVSDLTIDSVGTLDDSISFEMLLSAKESGGLIGKRDWN